MRVDANRLRGFLDCMHEEADGRDKRSAQISAIVKAAKEAGYDAKAVRKVFVRERMDDAARRQQDDLVETYEGALGPKGTALRALETGATLDQAAVASGLGRATVARAKAVSKQASNDTPPHDPETGEITDDLGKPTAPVAGLAQHTIDDAVPHREQCESIDPGRPAAETRGGIGVSQDSGTGTIHASAPPQDDAAMWERIDSDAADVARRRALALQVPA